MRYLTITAAALFGLTSLPALAQTPASVKLRVRRAAWPRARYRRVRAPFRQGRQHWRGWPAVNSGADAS